MIHTTIGICWCVVVVFFSFLAKIQVILLYAIWNKHKISTYQDKNKMNGTLANTRIIIWKKERKSSNNTIHNSHWYNNITRIFCPKFVFEGIVCVCVCIYLDARVGLLLTAGECFNCPNINAEPCFCNSSWLFYCVCVMNTRARTSSTIFQVCACNFCA